MFREMSDEDCKKSWDPAKYFSVLSCLVPSNAPLNISKKTENKKKKRLATSE